MATKQDLEDDELTSNFTKLNLDTDQIPAVVEMVTWNTNSSESEAHFSTIRDTLVRIVNEPIKHCITFFQEIKIGPDTMRKKWGLGADYKLAMPPLDSGLREAGVSTPQKGNGLEHVTGEILNELELERKGVKSEFAERMCGQQVTLKKKIGESEYTASITVVSYHAYYKHSDRKGKMLEFFKEMCKLADTQLKQTIIIGGDFNLPVLDWKDEVEHTFKDQVSVALYMGTPRRWNRHKFIDTFALVQPKDSKHRTEATFEETMGIYQFPMAGRVGDEHTALRDYPSSENRWFKYVYFNNADLKKVKDALVKKDDADLGSLEKGFKENEKEKKTKKDVKVTELPKEDTEERMKQLPEDAKVTELLKEDTKVKMKQLPKDTETDTNKKLPKEDMEEKVKKLPEETQKDTKKKKEEPSKENEVERKKKTPKKIKSKEQTDREKMKDIKDGKHLSEPFTKVNPSGPPAPLWPNSCLHQVLDHDPVLTRIKIILNLKQNDSAQDNATPEKRVTRSTKKP